MSSWGRLAVSIGGALIGNAILPGIGGAIGFMGGSILGNMIFPQKSKVEMPELAKYPVQTAQKGTPISYIRGTIRTAGNIIYAADAVPYVVAHSSGGGGGKGGGGGESKTYETRYRRSFLICVCEGPANIRRAWAGKTEISLTDFTWFDGNDNSGISTIIGKDYAEYKNYACAWFDNYELGNTEQIPNFVFELSSGEVDSDYLYIPSNGSLVVKDRDGSTIRTHTLPNTGCQSCDVARDGRYACVFTFGGGDSTCVKIYNYDGTDTEVVCDIAPLLALDTSTWYVHSCQFSKDGNYIYANVLCSYPNNLRYYVKWNSHTGELVDMELLSGANAPYSYHEYIVNDNEEFTIQEAVAMNAWHVPPELQTSKTWGVENFDGDRLGYVGGTGFSGDPETEYFQGIDNSCYAGEIGCFAAINRTWPSASGCTISVFNLSTEAWAGVKWDSDTSKKAYAICTDGTYLYVAGDTRSDGTNISKYSVAITSGILGAELEVTEVARGDARHESWVYPDSQMSTIMIAGSVLLVCYASNKAGNVREHWLSDLTQKRTVTTGTAFPISYWAELPCRAAAVPISYFISPAYDMYPPDIVKTVMERLGKDSILNEDKYNSVLNYCIEQDIKLSINFSQQKSWLDCVDYVNSHFAGFRWTDAGSLKLGVFRDEDVVEINGTPVNLTTDDFAVGDEENPAPPLKVQVRKYADTYNRIEVTWTDRDNNYDCAVAVAKAEADIRRTGERKKTVNLEGITNADLAQKMAYRLLIDSLYRKRTFSFALSYEYMPLERGDVVTLTDEDLGLDSQKVRITSINDHPNGRWLDIEAVEDGSELYPDITWSTQQTTHTQSEAPTLANSQIAFREDVNESRLYLSITPGNQYVNGWDIYRSYDGSSYDLVGRCGIDGITGGDANSAGTLQSNLPAHTAVTHSAGESFLVDIDTVTDLDTAITDQQFFNNLKLAKIGDEIIAYKTCEETSTEGVWRITGLIRGLFGTDPVAHASGETFVTLDNNFTYVYRPEDIGKTLYFKAVAFYGGQIQNISSVTTYSHLIEGWYQRPMGVSLLRLTSGENDYGREITTYNGSSFMLYWNLPGQKGSGANQGGADLNEDYPEWRYGDDEAELVGGNGVPAGNWLADSELQAIDLVFEKTDGTHIGQRSIAATAQLATIDKATDLAGETSAVIKVLPRRTLRTWSEHQITVTNN